MINLDKNQREVPIFKIFAELMIPNVTVQPQIDEVQVYLNRVVKTIISISKYISQWSKNRQRVSKIISLLSSNFDRKFFF